MPDKDNFWTTQTDDGRWGVKREGSDRNSRVFDKQSDAWEYAKDRARDAQGEAFLKGRDGKIRERNTHGNDPYPPKG